MAIASTASSISFGTRFLRIGFCREISLSASSAPVSEQLGHANAAVTAQHYARWAGGKAYRRPLEVQPGEIPADLIARIEGLDSHQFSHHAEEVGAS